MDNDERRKHPRVKLDIPVFCSLTVGEGGDIPCMVKNISATGLMAELPPALDLEVKRDLEVVVHSCPEFLSEYRNGVRCQIVWQSGNTVGVQFTKPPSISSDRLEEILDECGFDTC